MTDTAYTSIRYAAADGIARVTLDQPDKLKAFSEDMFREMRDALDRVDAGAADGSVSVLVITGAGRASARGRTSRPSTPTRWATPTSASVSCETGNIYNQLDAMDHENAASRA